ncbi:MAG: M20/M25/M40 family metallo-hydrolase [Candidatus Helarchaeota archaeon]
MDEVEFLKECIEIPSISGSEEQFSNFLLEKMKNLGLNAWKDHVGNVIGQIGTGTPVLLLCSHMDTVEGTIPVRIEKGKLYGRGAVDAKGSLISMVCAAAKFVKKKISGKIVVAGIVEEETTVNGINTLLDSLEHVDYAIFGEPSGIDRICIASKGRIHLHLLVKTLSGITHVSNTKENKNPIHIAISFWNNLKDRLTQRPFLGKTPYFSVEPNITVIKGGMATNVQPDICEMDIDIRFPSGIKSIQIIQEIEKVINEFQDMKNYQIKFEILSQIEAFRGKKDTNLALTLKNAIESVLKTDVKFLRKSGTNFMAIIANKLKIPVISYGPGDPTLEHTTNEYIEITEYQRAVDILEKFISNIFLENSL